MLVPFSWLKDYVDVDEETEDIAEKLLLSGTKVEQIKIVGKETLFDFEITPNRADCLGVIGIAREVSAIFGKQLIIPEPFSETQLTKKRKLPVVEVKDKNLCPYFTIGIIDNLDVGESSEWLKSRLEQAGIRPISNIVDVTNYVMLETAQPMHAFDLDKISGIVTIRSAKEGEQVTTLDGIKRKLNKGPIIIEDSEKIIDLAGLMGGENSEVDKDTKTIVLHVPIYDSVSIRRASQFTNLRTEASNRFEKQLDPNGHRYAFERAAHLFKIEANGSLASEIKSINYPVKTDSFTVSVEKVQKILGVKISEEDMINILSRLEFEILPSPSYDEHNLEIRPPSFRPDVKITEDIAEEIGRIWGYNRFPRRLPTGNIPTHEDGFLPDWTKVARDTLSNFGFTETYSHAMTSADFINKAGFDIKQTLKVNNRMTIDYEYLRPTLIIGLLESLSLNLNNYQSVSLYELGRVFSKETNRKSKLPHQPKNVAAVNSKGDFASLKGVVEELLGSFGIKDYTFEQAKNPRIWSKESAVLKLKNDEIGHLGLVSSEILKKFSVGTDVFGFELNFDKLVENSLNKVKISPIQKFPSVNEDLSIAVEPNVKVQEVLDAINSLRETKLKTVEIAEVISWRGKKSILLNLEYYDPKKTLVDSEIIAIRKRITETLEKNLKAELRT